MIARGDLSDLALQLFDAFDRQLAHNLIIRPEAPTALLGAAVESGIGWNAMDRAY